MDINPDINYLWNLWHMLYILLSDVNECESAPCMFGATCHDDINGYHCSCAHGYTGVHCETGEFSFYMLVLPTTRR